MPTDYAPVLMVGKRYNRLPTIRATENDGIIMEIGMLVVNGCIVNPNIFPM